MGERGATTMVSRMRTALPWRRGRKVSAENAFASCPAKTTTGDCSVVGGTSLARGGVMAAAAFAFALVCGVLMAGCSPAASTGKDAQEPAAETHPSAPAEVSFTDDMGRAVSVPTDPAHVVCGIGSLADMWELAGGEVAGAPEETSADYDLASPHVASIGKFAEVSQESIMALAPDVVFLTAQTTGQAGAADQTKLADGLQAAGAAVGYFKVTTFDDYLRVLRTMCDITGRDDCYDANGAAVKERIDAVVADYAPDAAGKTYLCGITYSQGLRPQRSASQPGSVISQIGAHNIVDGNEGLLSDFSIEKLLEVDPDYVFVIPMGRSEDAARKSLEALTENDAWSALSAVKAGRVIELPRALFVDKPNANWDDAYTLVGEAFRNPAAASDMVSSALHASGEHSGMRPIAGDAQTSEKSAR